MDRVELELCWYCPKCKITNDPLVNICNCCGCEVEIQQPSKWNILWQNTEYSIVKSGITTGGLNE